MLREYMRRMDEHAQQLGVTVGPDAYLFTLSPDGSTPLLPDTATHRYDRMAKSLGIKTTLNPEYCRPGAALGSWSTLQSASPLANAGPPAACVATPWTLAGAAPSTVDHNLQVGRLGRDSQNRTLDTRHLRAPPRTM